MARVYKTVRLAYETKIWLDELIEKRTVELQESMHVFQLQTKLEEELFEANKDILDGISVNVTLNITSGSIIEQAVRGTREFSNEQWYDVAMEMENAIRYVRQADVSDFTPRIYISHEILNELEALQIRLKENGERIPRLSYIIKLVIFGFKNMK